MGRLIRGTEAFDSKYDEYLKEIDFLCNLPKQ